MGRNHNFLALRFDIPIDRAFKDPRRRLLRWGQLTIGLGVQATRGQCEAYVVA
jgi:hypothetical protein